MSRDLRLTFVHRLLLFSVCVSVVRSKICPTTDIRNDIQNLTKLTNCTTIQGDLRIVLIEKVKSPSEYENYCFPNLTEITGYLMFYKVFNLTSIATILPNLRVIRGNTDLVLHYSLMFYDMPDLQEIGLSNLLFVGRGDAIIDKNPKLCFVDTVNWTMIGTSLTRYQNNSVNCPQCLDYCKHCWNADTCQEPDTDKCHEECLGCTIHHSSRHCKACKNFKNGDECVADCPKEKYRNTIRSSCLTEQECLSIDPGKWWTFKNECVNACPDQYEVKESGGCKYCGDNCLVICNFTGFIEDVSHEFKGCTYLNGSLEIRLLNKNAAEDLEINLSSLRIIEGYLKIYRSKDITSLMFLKNLREIRGSTLENDHHAIFMYENQNLQKLWEFNDKFNLTIKRGTISFHNNPQLCLSEIQMLANLTGQTGKYSNLDVSPFSNGDKSLCSVIDLNSRVMEITPNNATVVWQTPIDKGVVGYTIFYSNANKNESSSKVIDQCGESEWISVFTSNTSFLIKDLRPFTKYAYYIKVLSSSGGQSEINYFDTLSDDPKIDGNDISAISHNSTAINVTWAMPVSLNGIFAYYQIIVYMEPDWEDFILQRDYCHYKYIDETMKQPVAKKPKFMDNCDCLPPNKPEYMFKMNNVFTMCDPKWSSKYGFDECKSFQYQIDEEDSPTNETFLKGENQMIESRYRVINITDISQTSYMVDNLKHFRIYVFYLQACNQNRTEKPQCSGVIQVSNRTLKNNAADDVFNLEVRRSNLTESTVDVFWKEPEDPNSLIVAYNIEYTNQDVHNNGRVKQCITSRKFKRDSGYRLNLFSGKHVIRVQAVSLAGYGRFSGYYEFYIPHAQKDSSYWVYILCAILLVVVPIVIYLVFRYRHKRLFDNIRLIANINPEYTGVVLEKDDWEIDRENVVIEKSIGEGTFGSVYVGFLKDRNCPCAIKTIKDQVGMREQVEFLNEASVMKSFSNAHHVVKLFGVVSIGHPKLVVMELMDRGDLKRHLRACRDSTSQSITSTDMYKMAIEIADGMAYLAAKKYVHRDLAVRNCMVAADYTVKIGDFGMARDVYQSDYYKKETRGLLPVRWMAPESLIDGVFTSDSDVWSYGIVLWEIATLAEQPYQGLANEQVNNFVSSGGKLDCPNSCPDLLYEIMDSCWQWRPMRRPQFLDIIECLLQHRVQQRLWENFGLVSFYHSKDGLDYRLNHRQRAENPPAMMQGTRMRYRVSDDTVDFDY